MQIYGTVRLGAAVLAAGLTKDPRGALPLPGGFGMSAAGPVLPAAQQGQTSQAPGPRPRLESHLVERRR